MKLRSLFAAVILILAASPAEARFTNGHELFQKCSAKPGYDPGYCVGFVAATFNAMNDGNSLFGFRVCVPENMLLVQPFEVAKSYLKSHPEERHMQASFLLAQAFAIAFPCTGAP